MVLHFWFFFLQKTVAIVEGLLRLVSLGISRPSSLRCLLLHSVVYCSTLSFPSDLLFSDVI